MKIGKDEKKDETKDAIGRYVKIKMRGQYSFLFEKYLHFKNRGKKEMVSKYTKKLMILEYIHGQTDRQTHTQRRVDTHTQTLKQTRRQAGKPTDKNAQTDRHKHKRRG